MTTAILVDPCLPTLIQNGNVCFILGDCQIELDFIQPLSFFSVEHGKWDTTCLFPALVCERSIVIHLV